MSSPFVLDFWIFVLVITGIYTIFSLGLQVHYGVAGLMNFGHVSMMALSGYTMAIFVITFHWSFWWASALGVCVAGLGGAFLGLTTLRLRGDYFAIVSIAFSEIVRYIIKNWASVTGGSLGSSAIPGQGDLGTYNETPDNVMLWVSDRLYPLIGDRADNRDTQMAILVWSVAIIVLILVARFEKLPWARTLRALREEDHVPAALGKNVFVFRLQALIFGSVIAGIAGIFWATQFAVLAPDDFETLTTFFAWMIIILGGATRVRGVVMGAFVFSFLFAGTRFFEFWPFTTLDAAHRAYVRLIIIGLVLIWLMLRRPQGILGKRAEMVLE